LKLFFERLLEDETVIDFDSSSADFKLFKSEWGKLNAGILNDATAKVTINIVDAKFLLRLDLIAKLNLLCDRCLNEYEKSIEILQAFLYSEKKADKSKGDLEEESSEERFYIKGNPVELLDIFKEELLLELPQKNICSYDCKGICEKCGANLNLAECSCEKGEKFNPILIKKR